MRIRVFQSDKGDCLLLRTADGKSILVDGGMTGSYREHVRPFLGRLRRTGKELDLVYVSHIDQDHIAGILKLFDDEIAWRRYLFHKNHANGNRSVPKPKFPRPPLVHNVWNNAFHTQITENSGAIEDMLAAFSRVWGQLQLDEFQHSSIHASNLVTSKKQAVQLSNRIGKDQLNIPLNAQFAGKLALRPGTASSIQLGNSTVRVLGPSAADLTKLRKKWNKWLEDAEDTLRDLRREAREDARDIGNAADVQNFLINAKSRGGVTLPNLASLMLHIDEGGDTALLTGDGHADDVIVGLEKHNLMRDDGTYHVKMLKIPHHGSTHNFEPTRDFFKRVTADHYVFCGNGSDDNPELDVIDLLFSSRMGKKSELNPSQQADNKFKVWINSHPSVVKTGKKKTHMEKLEKHVNAWVKKGNGQAKSTFLRKSSFEFRI